MTTNELEPRWRRLISPTNPVSFTDAHENLLAGWPQSAVRTDAFISFYQRVEHARRRVFDNHPMALRSIASATDTPTYQLTAAWHEFNAGYGFPVLHGESHRERAERWQGRVIRALDSLEAIGEPIPLAGFRPEQRQPAAERKLLELLAQRPEGAEIGIAATMVLLATSPVEIAEAEARRALGEPDEPKLVRVLRGSAADGWFEELWILPTPRHGKVKDADMVVVEFVAGDQQSAPREVLDRLVIADPANPSEAPIHLGAISVARGPRAGARLGAFASDRNGARALARTMGALAQLARSGEPPEPRPS